MIQAQTTQLINTNKLKQFIGFPVVTFATRWTYGPSAGHETEVPWLTVLKCLKCYYKVAESPISLITLGVKSNPN